MFLVNHFQKEIVFIVALDLDVLEHVSPEIFLSIKSQQYWHLIIAELRP